MGENTLSFCAQNCSFAAYNVNGKLNATIVVVRGQTYTFTNQQSGIHPMSIQSTPGIRGTRFTSGVTPASPAATVTFVVPMDAPDMLFYQCNLHADMKGQIVVVNSLADPRLQGLTM
jgi:plastocyanin